MVTQTPAAAWRPTAGSEWQYSASDRHRRRSKVSKRADAIRQDGNRFISDQAGVDQRQPPDLLAGGRQLPGHVESNTPPSEWPTRW